MKTSLTQTREQQKFADTAATQQMSLDPESTPFLMNVLSKLYTKPAYSVLQEFLSNALDAHVDSGSTTPIEVTLPDGKTVSDLIIRDYGPGLNEEQFRQIVAKYGASTARDTNRKRGGFGLGMKSAYAVSDTFTIVSYQSGKKLTVKFLRTDTGTPYLLFEPAVDTFQPDGLEAHIQVPDKMAGQVNPFELERAGFFTGLHPNQVKVTYKDKPYDFTNQSAFTSDRFTAVQDMEGILLGWVEKTPSYDDDDRVVIGGITTPATLTEKTVYKTRNFRTVLNVPIGTVDLPPARDQLLYSPRTQDTLTAIHEEFKVYYHKYVLDRMAQMTPYEAFQYAIELKNSHYFQHSNLEYQGRKVPTAYTVSTEKESIKDWLITVTSMELAVSSSKLSGVWLASIGKKTDKTTFLVVECETKAQVDRVKKNIKLYMEATDRSKLDILTLSKNHPLLYWFSSINGAITYEQFMQELTPVQQKRTNQTSSPDDASYQTFELDKASLEHRNPAKQEALTTELVPVTKLSNKVLYLDKTQVMQRRFLSHLMPIENKTTRTGSLNSDFIREFLLSFQHYVGPGTSIVYIPGNRSLKKFQEAVPQATPLTKALYDFIDTQKREFGEDEIGEYNLIYRFIKREQPAALGRYKTGSVMMLLERGTLNLPDDLREYLTLLQQPVKDIGIIPEYWLRRFQVEVEDYRPKVQLNMQALLDKYPLLFASKPQPYFNNDLYYQSLLKYITMCDTLDEQN